MTKLLINSGLHEKERSIINNWMPIHVLEIYEYLKVRKKIKLEIYKDMKASKYILKFENALMFFKTSKELCCILEQKYYEELKNEYRKIQHEKGGLIL